MAPHGPSGIPPPLVGGKQQTLAELHAEDLFYEARASELADAVQHRTVRWVDLPPVMAPAPDRPPSGEEVIKVEELVSPDKLMKKVFLLAGDEFSDWQLDSFSSKDGMLLSIAPHAVNRYVKEGPISAELYGPVMADFVLVTNMSKPGQSWYELSVASLEDYVAAWCDCQPSVTILCLGFWDVVLGKVAWTPESVSPGVYGRYVLYHLDLFLNEARRYCFRNRICFDGWMCNHRFLYLGLPAWLSLTPDIESSFTIAASTWRRMRQFMYKDIYALEDLMWSKYRMVTFNPQVPSALLGTSGVYFRLGRRYSRYYVAQVLSALAKLVCVRPACQLPADLQSIKDHMWDRTPRDDRRREILTSVRSCGAYWAHFMPIGITFQQMYNLGHW